MQLSKNSQLKDSILNWSISIFILLLITASLISHLFQNPKERTYKYTNYSQLLSTTDVQKISFLKIHNSQGDLTLEKQSNGDWLILSPRKLMAKQHPINLLLKALSTIHITKVFNKDPINLTNFALNSPRSSITFKTRAQQKTKEVSIYFGMLNPILKANYITLPNKKVIYQTSTFDFPLDQLNFTDLIETRVFPFAINNIKQIKITRYNKVFLNIEQQNKQWLQNRKTIPLENAQKYLMRLLTTKSHIILDQLTSKQQKRLERYFKTPPIQIDFTFSNGKSRTFFLTTLFKRFPGVEINDLFFFIKDADSTTYKILLKQSYSVFLKSTL